jgi:hypothetical protein
MTRLTRRQESPQLIGREFAHAFDQVFLGLSRVSYAESVRILLGIEAEYMAQISNHPELALELRRRTAERILEQALVHGCTLTECRKKLSYAEGLGWSNIEARLHFHLIYARGMVVRGHYRAAIAIAQHRIADVEYELERVEGLPRRLGREYFLDWLTHFSEIINEVGRSGLAGYSNRWDVGGRFVRN